MPAKCELPGLHFQYPENWTLHDEATEARHDSVTVYSPTGAFWSVVRYPRSTDPAQLVRAAIDAMRQEYDSLEAHEAFETIGSHELAGYDLFFYCLDMTNTAEIDHLVSVLREVAPAAEKAGVIIGLENYLSAADNLKLIDRVDSPAMSVYYDVGNSTDKGYECQATKR